MSNNVKRDMLQESNNVKRDNTVATLNENLIKIIQQEADALMTFKAGIMSDPMSHLASWNYNTASAPVLININISYHKPVYCSWEGISCSNNSIINTKSMHTSGFVVGLNLNSCNLSGTISPSLASLPALSVLDLSFNNFSGALHESLFQPNCPLTFFRLSENNLQGNMPPSLGQNCKQLKTLRPYDTGLSGPIPYSIWTQLPHLQYLSISSDKPQKLAVASFPPRLAFCSTIESLYLEGFNCTGALFPHSLADCKSLKDLWISVVGLEGVIPDAFWQLPNLWKLVIQDVNAGDYIDKNPGASPPFKLSGFLHPGQGFGFCDTIQYMYIDGVNLTGQIPFSLGLCVSLQELDLSHGNLQGPIPASLGNLTNLRVFSLVANNLTQGIPPTLSSCTHLQTLSLGYNPLAGSIPKELRKLSQLQFFYAPKTNLGGAIPCEIFLNWSLVVQVDLSNNHLEGMIESLDLTKLTQLQDFIIYMNSLFGGVPSTLTKSKSLVIFDVGNNELSGQIPYNNDTKIIGLSKLRILSLGYNQLNGKIPKWVWRLPLLQVLDLSNNKLGGPMPMTLEFLSYFKLPQNASRNQTTLNEEVLITLKSTIVILTYVVSTRIYIDVSMNNLEGEIPKSFGELQGLTIVNLSHNNIQGPIPRSFGKLKNLEVLDLSNNLLNGSIPQELTSLSMLAVINVSHNLFEGSIPVTNGFNTRFPSSSFQDNPHLCGDPLRSCIINNTTIESVRWLDPSRVSIRSKVMNWMNDFINLWGLIIGYIFGTLIGFLGYYFLAFCSIH